MKPVLSRPHIKRTPCINWRSPQNADHADCRLQTADTVQTMQTVQTVHTEYFFLTLDSLFSVMQLPSSAQYVFMLAIYPQATQTQHLTVDSIDKRVYK